MIEVRNISKKYDGEEKKTLSNVSFVLPDTGLYYIVGESGSGKTTLATIIGCMDDEYEGEVLFNGKAYTDMNAKEKARFRLLNIGFSFQGGFLDPKATVHDELVKTLIGYEICSSEKDKRIRELLRYFEISGLENRKISELSGGEKKRVSLARSMVRNPNLLILDEPTAGLNPALRSKTFSKIRKISENSLVLIITHDKIDSRGAGLIKVQDGKAVLVQNPIDRTKKKKIIKNSKINILSLFVQSVKTFFKHFSSSGPAMLAITISLTAFGIAMLLVEGVRNGFSDIGTSAFDETTVVVDPKDNLNISGRSYLMDDDFARNVYWDNQSLVDGYGVEYPLNLNNNIASSSTLYLHPNENYKYPENFGLDIVAHPLWRSSYPDIKITGGNYPTLENDEVFLGLPKSGINYLTTSFPKIYEDFLNGKVLLKGNVSVDGVKGNKEFSLKVRGFYESGKPSLMHTSTLFGSHVLEDVVGFGNSQNLTTLDVKPHTLKKGGIVYVKTEKLGSFYRQFTSNDSYKKYALEKFSSDHGPKTGLTGNHVKLYIKEKKYAEILPQHMIDIADRTDDFSIREYAFSSSVYTYVQGGMYAGFSLPVFLSDNRSSLIELSDMNTTTDKNLGMFQIAGKEIPDGVVAADLTSSLNGEGITFSNPLNPKMLIGKYPKSDDEIAISSSLAKKIYGSNDVQGRILCLLLLSDIQRSGDVYHNIFNDADLKVSGVIESDEDTLYHDAFFPTAFAFSCTEKSGIDLTVDSAVLKFTSVEEMEKSLPSLRKEFTNYDFYCPFVDLVQDMEEVLEKISMALNMFASIGLLLSVFLMLLTTHLAVKNDEKGIGDYLALGFSPAQTRFIYIMYVMVIGLFSFVNSSIAILISGKIVEKELASLFSASVGAVFTPYIAAFLLCFSVSLLVSVFATRKIKKMSPRLGFRL